MSEALDPLLVPFGVDELVGEHLDVPVRMVVSGHAGEFELAAGVVDGMLVEPGTVLGYVGGEPVRSRFFARLAGVVAHPGERLRRFSPVAWLHAHPRPGGPSPRPA